jgi:regulator of protease activity HflC (stomatin/prohibitin superfamily)
MDPILVGTLSAIFVALTGGYLSRSIRIVGPEKQAMVERLGRRHKTLKPGVNFIVPFLDQVKAEQTTAEKISEIPLQSCITRDNAQIDVDAVFYWRITNLEKASYEIVNVEKAVNDLVKSNIRSEIGKLDLDNAASSRSQVSGSILTELDEVTSQWGIKVTRVEIQEIRLPETVRQSMERQVSSERQKRAEIALSEGERTANVNRASGEAEAEVTRAKADKEIQLLQAEGYVQAMERIAGSLAKGENYQKAMQFLIAQSYIEMGKTIGESPSAKVMFMDPNSVPGMVQALLSMSGQPNLIEADKQPYSASGNVKMTSTEKYAKPIDIPGLNAPEDKPKAET